MFKDKTLAENVSALLIIYIVILGLSYGLYFALAPKGGVLASDIVNISVCASTLLGPIILLFTLTGWKEQHNKSVLKEISFEGIKDLLNIKNSLDLIRLAMERIFYITGVDNIPAQDIELIYQNHHKAQSASLEFQSKLVIFGIYRNFDKDAGDLDVLINDCLDEIEFLLNSLNCLVLDYRDSQNKYEYFKSNPANFLHEKMEKESWEIRKDHLEFNDVESLTEDFKKNQFLENLDKLKKLIDEYVQILSKVTVA